ncbi:MAG: F0F1 ATP synthase subunit A [Vampirovibrionales bacterium]
MNASHFWVESLAGQQLHINTLIMAYTAMGMVLLLAWNVTRQLCVQPSKLQLIAEQVYGFCRGITLTTAGKRGDEFMPYVGALFLFILTCNLMGQLPLKLIPLPHGELLAATGDFNVPAALALCTLGAYFFYGLKKKGFSYFGHYLTPLPLLTQGKGVLGKLVVISIFWPFMLLNILEDVTRPGSLMLRLFFNIFIGEILGGIAHSVSHIGLPALVMCMELFVAVLQAYIFAIISSVYISMMTEEHHNH